MWGEWIDVRGTGDRRGVFSSEGFMGVGDGLDTVVSVFSLVSREVFWEMI